MATESVPIACQIGREMLVSEITTFLVNESPQSLTHIRSVIEREIDDAGPDALSQLAQRLAAAGSDWAYFPPDPLARRIHHALAERLLDPASTVVGREHLDGLGDGPVVMVANHLSYADANLIEVLLRRAGGGGLADRMTVIAGPKVYSDTARRFSSLCFGTIRVPQSSAVASEDAVMDTRQVARAARRAIDRAFERCSLGEALLVFPEGRRSRIGAMQPLLPGASRYLDYPGTTIVPIGLTGSEAMFPVGDDTLHTVKITAHVGRAMSGHRLREAAGTDRRLTMDVLGVAIADLIPSPYRGVYADDAPGLEEARRIRHALSD